MLYPLLTGKTIMKRTPEQRKAYAFQRMSLAVDRVIMGDCESQPWAMAWAVAAGVRPRSCLDSCR